EPVSVSTVWLVGRPVAHSLSPAMHNAAFAMLGLPHRYETHEVAAAELPATFDRLRREGMLGANVTIPHKEAALRLVDEASDEARRLKKVGLLVNATPLGLLGEDVLAGFALRDLPLMVADLVPTAEETPLVRRARQAQHVRVMDGLLMLLHQAARSFTVWTGS